MSRVKISWPLAGAAGIWVLLLALALFLMYQGMEEYQQMIDWCRR